MSDRTPPTGADPWAELASLEGVGSAMAAARDGIDALLRDRGLRRTAPDLTGESLLRGAHASAVLAGSTATLAEVRAGADDDIARAAVRVSTELLGLVPVLARAPLQAFARLHAVAAKGLVPEEELGRPASPEAAARLATLSRLLLAPSRTTALVTAAVTHAELGSGATFGSAGGIVARAAERLVLVARGVDPASVTVPEAGHLLLRRGYEEALAGYERGDRAGVHRWLLYAAEAYTAGAQASPLVDDHAG